MSSASTILSTPKWTCAIPQFTPQIVIDQLRDGYWVESPDFNQDGKPDLIGYGLAMGEIYWYENGPQWKRHLICDDMHMPVGMDYGDITGKGFNDPVICYYLYGPGGRIDDPDPQGGKIDWVENPGYPQNTQHRWQRRYIGRTTGMHRLRVGYFTQRDKIEVFGFPIVAHENVHALLPVVLFQRPNDFYNAPEWPMTVVNNSYFRMIHGAIRKQNLIPGSDLDSVLLASDEGITWLYFDAKTEKWVHVPIGTGELTQFEQTGFKGSGDVDCGRLGDDPFAYVAAVEPFHGNTVAVYVKESDGPADQVSWRRFLLDVFGDPNENGEGPGHCVMCADFDGDGDEEFLIALRGPAPWQGVMYYKAIDARKGIFARWHVATESAARIALGDFYGRGKIDFATIAYSVAKYYVATNANIIVYRNDIEL
jgi:Aldos-2-ulose dehydratase, beta-propeller domain